MPRRWRALVLLLGQTGLRIGEAAGLRWQDVNLGDEWLISCGEAIAPRSILVRSNWTNGERTTLKGREKDRRLPLTSDIVLALGDLRGRSKFTQPDDPVFASFAGTPMDAHNVGQRSLKTAGKRVGVPWVSWHVFRHSNATLADIAGMTQAERQKVLGHASAGMTQNYTHSELDRVRESLERMTRIQ